jgi:hypothetical protein
MFLIFNFSNLQWWKLNTREDWVQFLAMSITSAVVLFIYYRITVHSRSEASAVDRVNRRFKRWAEKDSHYYKNVGLRVGDADIVVDNLLVDKHGILLGHTFGRGLEAYGDPDEPFWRIKDAEGSELVPNPLYEAEQMVHPIQRALAAKEIYGANIDGLAVFADNFAEPKLFVGGTPKAITLAMLKKFFDHRNSTKVTIRDPAKVAAALETLFFEVPPKENHSQRKARLKAEKREKKAQAKAQPKEKNKKKAKKK